MANKCANCVIWQQWSAFIVESQGMPSVKRSCQIKDVSSRGYRTLRSCPLSQSQRKDLVAFTHVREQFALSLGSYGRPCKTEELKGLSLDVGHRRVGRLMKQDGLKVGRSKKYTATTDSNHSFSVAPKLSNHELLRDKQDEARSGDPRLEDGHRTQATA